MKGKRANERDNKKTDKLKEKNKSNEDKCLLHHCTVALL